MDVGHLTGTAATNPGEEEREEAAAGMAPDADENHTAHVVDVALFHQITQIGTSLVADTLVLDRQASLLTEILVMKGEEVLVGMNIEEAVLVDMNAMGIEEIVEEAATKP